MKHSISILLIFSLLAWQLCPCFAAEPVITGEVTAVNGDEIIIDRGADSGIREGAEGIVYYERIVSGESVRLTVARVRVVEVLTSKSTLRVIDRTAEIKAGYRVDLQVVAAPPAPIQVEKPRTVEQRKPEQQQVVQQPKKKSKKKWYIAGGVLVGGVIYYILSTMNQEENGTAVIDVTFPD